MPSSESKFILIGIIVAVIAVIIAVVVLENKSTTSGTGTSNGTTTNTTTTKTGTSTSTTNGTSSNTSTSSIKTNTGTSSTNSTGTGTGTNTSTTVINYPVCNNGISSLPSATTSQPILATYNSFYIGPSSNNAFQASQVYKLSGGSARIVVVGGGGGGASGSSYDSNAGDSYGNSGAGGGGGAIVMTPLLPINTLFTVQVGTGGLGGIASSGAGSSGSNGQYTRLSYVVPGSSQIVNVISGGGTGGDYYHGGLYNGCLRTPGGTTCISPPNTNNSSDIPLFLEIQGAGGGWGVHNVSLYSTTQCDPEFCSGGSSQPSACASTGDSIFVPTETNNSNVSNIIFATKGGNAGFNPNAYQSLNGGGGGGGGYDPGNGGVATGGSNGGNGGWAQQGNGSGVSPGVGSNINSWGAGGGGGQMDNGSGGNGSSGVVYVFNVNT